MEIDGRKLKILKAIISNYLETGEPVGSRTISKYTDLNLSSATIRNEMSDLEELGFIVQPHTSAGRIPTDKAYRLYVDTMMEEKDREINNLKDMLVEAEEKMDMMLKNVAKVLAVNTNYATVVTAPAIHGNKLKFIQISRVDDSQILAIIEKMIKQRRDAIEQFTAGNRPDLVESEQAEIDVLSVYMPEQLSEAEIAAEVAEAVKGASGPKDMGKVMGALKGRLAGRAAMGMVSKLVKKALMG